MMKKTFTAIVISLSCLALFSSQPAQAEHAESTGQALKAGNVKTQGGRFISDTVEKRANSSSAQTDFELLGSLISSGETSLSLDKAQKALSGTCYDKRAPDVQKAAVLILQQTGNPDLKSTKVFGEVVFKNGPAVPLAQLQDQLGGMIQGGSLSAFLPVVDKEFGKVLRSSYRVDNNDVWANGKPKSQHSASMELLGNSATLPNGKRAFVVQTKSESSSTDYNYDIPADADYRHPRPTVTSNSSSSWLRCYFPYENEFTRDGLDCSGKTDDGKTSVTVTAKNIDWTFDAKVTFGKKTVSYSFYSDSSSGGYKSTDGGLYLFRNDDGSLSGVGGPYGDFHVQCK